MNGEFPEEVDNLVATFRQAEPENEWGYDNAEDLLQENHDLQLVHCGKLSLDLITVKSILPVCRHVVGILNHVPQRVFRLEHEILIRYCSVHDRPKRSKYSKIK